jgi:hypothetical protein
MGCTIIKRDRATGQVVSRRRVNALLSDAKAYAEAERTPDRKISVVTDRGVLWLLVPRQRNTGPGGWRWERAS